MPIMLGKNSYGKSRVRIVKVERDPEGDVVRDLTVHVRLEGDFEAAHTQGDNRNVVATDTMKNTVYVLSRRHALGTIDEFAVRLARHFLDSYRQVERSHLEISEVFWSPMQVAGRPHPSAFTGGGIERRTVAVSAGREGLLVRPGIADLLVMKTRGSGFEDFPRDVFTTLRETSDRILATVLTATWRMAGREAAPPWPDVRNCILEVFAGHHSRSVQHTLYAVGEQVLARFAAVQEIHITMPNKHHLLVDLAPFGDDNPNLIFQPVDEPYGLIEATVVRSA